VSTQRLGLVALWRREFSTYDAGRFRQDVFAGLTVAAVALPLALAFGVASGATAAAGLVTAILSGLVIGALSGAPYQISGPTGAMSAVLILVSQRYGLEAVWLTGVLGGVLILLIGLLRLGRFVAFIPAPVITGFTAGIAVIIVVGQVDSLIGVETPVAPTAAAKLWTYVRTPPVPDPRATAVAALVVATLLAWPSRLARYVPGSLAGIFLATLLTAACGWQVPQIGEIPRTLLLDRRLGFEAVELARLGDLVAPTLSIAALGAVESLLCGAVASRMTGIRLQANQELIAQGIGNIVVPFFGGVPATAAIARTSVGIKSGGQTRVVSIVHALALLASAVLFAPLISRIPLAALAGVLVVTAVRMNEWEAIRFMFGRRFPAAVLTFAATLVATVTLDLTQAILIGAAISAAIFINSVARLEVTVRDIDPERLRERGVEVRGNCPHIRVAYLTGPLFFAATNTFNEAFAREDDVHVLILSMRGVPMIDLSGIEALRALHERLWTDGRVLMLTGVGDTVMRMLRRAGLAATIGEGNFYWSADRAIRAAEEHHTCPRDAEPSAPEQLAATSASTREARAVTRSLRPAPAAPVPSSRESQRPA
jgi:SulP family sulfate permease